MWSDTSEGKARPRSTRSLVTDCLLLLAWVGDVDVLTTKVSDTRAKASKEQLKFNEPHPPAKNALDAFSRVIRKTKEEIVKSRRHWDVHEPKMWSRASQLSDKELTSFDLERDLVLVSSAATTYGTIILGKIRIPGIRDVHGEGFVHVRCVVHSAYLVRKVRVGISPALLAVI